MVKVSVPIDDKEKKYYDCAIRPENIRPNEHYCDKADFVVPESECRSTYNEESNESDACSANRDNDSSQISDDQAALNGFDKAGDAFTALYAQFSKVPKLIKKKVRR